MLVNLKTAIAARGFLQVDFALTEKIPPSTLSDIIHERRRADASLRARIAQTLDADESWLFSSVVRIPRPTGVSEDVAPAALSCAPAGAQ